VFIPAASATVLTLSGVAFAALAARVGGRDRPGARRFGAAAGTTAAAALLLAAGVAATPVRTATWVTATMALPVVWTAFAVEYAGVRPLTTPRATAALAAPAAVGAAAGLAYTALAPMTAGGTGTAAMTAMTPLTLAFVTFVFGTLYAGALVAGGAGLLAWTARRSTYLDARLGAALAATVLAPWVVLEAVPLALSPAAPAYDAWAAAGFGTAAAAAWTATGRLGLFETTPAAGTVGPRTALSEMDDAVVVVDPSERVVRSNPAAGAALGVDDAAGDPLMAVLGVTLSTLRSADDVAVDTPTGRRRFEATVSAMVDDHDHELGHVVVLRDVTDRRIRSQRLAVLNRVLRHNLRNEMTVVKGRAEALRADGAADAADDIAAVADDLVSLGETARRVEEMLAAPADGGPVDAAALVADAAGRLRERFPAATVAVDAPESAPVAAAADVVAPALADVAENAVVHNDDDPRVELRVRRAGAEVLVTVADDGPGIPAAEVAAVLDGEESPLQHGSGVGLWAAKWAAVRAGGDLRFAESDRGGAAVTLALPGVGAATAPAGDDPVATDGG